MAIALFLGTAAHGHALASPSADPGPLVVIGGGLSADNEAVYRVILNGRHGDGPLCVISTAGADPVGSAASAVARFDRWGGEGTARAHPLSEDDPAVARDPEVVAALSECAGYFFTGGIQSRILNLFRPEGEGTPAGDAILARWEAGAVVSGSSAGAAMMSDPMIAGGTSQGAFRNGTREGGVRLDPGMGFLPDLLVDQHFLARGRIGRLLVAVLGPDGVRMGAGIDEDTALVVRGRDLEVVGASGVVLVDGRSANPDIAPAGSRAFAAIRVELLGPGDRMSLDDWAVRPAPTKAPIGSADRVPRGQDATGSDAGNGDVFARWAFLHAVEAMGRGREASSEHEVDGGSMLIRKGANFRALVYPAPAGPTVDGATGTGPDGSAYGLSAGPFLVRIQVEEPAGSGR
ncbi:hypothetical protein BH23GEM11_BH23GEM11_17410 [soil metagenome]